MTPRSIESKNELDLQKYSEILFDQQNQVPNRDLREDSPSFHIQHPAIIHTQMTWESSPHKLSFKPFRDYFFELIPLENLKSLKPYQLHKFLTDNQDLKFQLPWSGVKLSRTPITPPENLAREHYLTQIWLDYALSPEIWASSGKWPRFHQKLTKIFQDHNLLETSKEIGFYHLKSKVKLIEKYGFKGDDLGGIYQIILPWDFSLSSLLKLEEILTQEF